MTKVEKKQVCRLVCEIIYISFVCVFLTYFWFGPRKAMQKVQKDLGYQTTGLSPVQITKEVQSKKITIDNKDGKGDLMLVLQGQEKETSPVYYQVMTNGTFSEERCLAEDGAIYLLALEDNQKTTLEIRMWTEENEVVNGSLIMLPVVYSNQV